MFTNPSAAPTSVTATAPSNSSSRPSRTDRIRTLGLLRGYRQSHSHLFSHTTEEAAEVLPAESNAVSEPISSSTIIPVEEIKTVEDSPTTAVELSPRVQAEASEKKSSPVRWIPGAGSLTGVSRSTVQAQATAASRVTAVPNSREAIASAPALDSATMARTRAANGQTSSYRGLIPTYTAAALDFARLDRGSPNNASNSASSSTRPQEQAVPTTDAAPATSPGGGQSQMPSIRFVPHQDVHSTRPSLQFQAVSRIVSNEGTILRVGRYSEREEKAAGARDGNNTTSGPVGFKSKVVSRRHCEFWCTNGQWYIKDVRSSSGTFLNHIRLSQPNVESRPFPVNDGDVVQLGIDFKGGEEMIFRCVKIRVECNRGWQKALNNFNMATHKNLRSMAKTRTKATAKEGGGSKGDAASINSTECSICLFPISPCQSLFVAPCSHVWHFKCIRPILNGATYPQFLCPNCRARSDLEAEVDELVEAPEEWEEDLVEEDEPTSGPDPHIKPSNAEDTARQEPTSNGQSTGTSSAVGLNLASDSHHDLAAAVGAVSMRDDPDLLHTSTDQRQATGETPSTRSGRDTSGLVHSSDDDEGEPASSINHPNGIPIPSPNPRDGSNQDGLNVEGPTTPRTDAGPFVFDGSGGLVAPSTAQNDRED